jgi:hypothetical protein
MRPIQKINKMKKKKRSGGMAQIVECLHSLCKALSSNPSTLERREEGKERGGKRGKTVSKCYILYDSIYITFLNKKIIINTFFSVLVIYE